MSAKQPHPNSEEVTWRTFFHALLEMIFFHALLEETIFHALLEVIIIA